MADRELRLRVGAAIDASFGQVMASVVEAAKRARRQIAAEMSAGAKEGAKAQVTAAATSKAAIASTTTAVKTAKQQADAMAADVLRKAKSNAREKVAIEKAAMVEVERDLRQHNARKVAAAREAAKEEANAAKAKGSPRDLSRGGAMLMRAGGAALGMGARMVGSALSGMGVDTSMVSQLKGANSRQTLATQISASGWIPTKGVGPAGSDKYVDPNALMSDARATANATGTDTGEVLEGVHKFTAMTGDLQTARDSMMEIGKIAKANGADFSEMMEASSNIAIAMGDIPDKGKHLAAIMRTIAGQGQLGAVEIKDMATQMGKLTAQANFFKIDPMSAATLAKSGVTDGAGQRIAVMGAMAQWARAKGGRITSQQATQASMAFMRDAASPTEVKRMAAQGINVYADKGHTTVRDPLQLFLEVAKKAQVSGGLNRDVINKVFPNQQSRAVGNAMTMDYNAAYAEAAKKGETDETKRHQFAMESLTEKFQGYLKVTQSNEEVATKFGIAMQTAESQTKILNNQLGKAAEELSTALLPAVMALTPVFVALATSGADALSRILGIDTASDKSASGAIRKGKDAATLAEAIVDEASAPGKQVYDFTTGKMTTEKNPAKITPENKQMFDDAIRSAKKEIAQKQAIVNAEGDVRSGMLGAGKAYKNMSDEEVTAEANSTLGDVQAKAYLKDKAQLDVLKETLNKLSNSIDKLDVLKTMGRVQEVAIVADHTTPPAGGVTPLTSGTGPVDSSCVEPK